MKKKFIIFLIFIFAYTLIVSCKSCVSGLSQSNKNFDLEFKSNPNDTLLFENSDTLSVMMILLDSEKVDTIKKIIFDKKIEPIKVDTIQRIKQDSTYKELEKVERNIINQQKTIDSLLIIRKK